jgi:hypothetical protein
MRLRALSPADIALEFLTDSPLRVAGQKDRITMLPEAVKGPLAEHLLRVRDLHQHDLAVGNGSVYLPDALGRKYPNAATQWGWQYVFPAAGLSRDPRSSRVRRHHLDPTTIQKRCAGRSPSPGS